MSPSPAWRTPFRYLLAGSAASRVGVISASTASPLLALSLGSSAVYAGWIAAAGTLPGLLVHIPAGHFADLLDRRRLMLVSQTVRCLSTAVVLLGLFFSDHPLRFLLVGAAIEGICAAFYHVAEVKAVRDLVPDEELEGALALNEARNNVALVFGRPVGGWTFGLHYTLPYALNTLTSLISLFTLSRVPARPKDEAAPSAASPEPSRPGRHGRDEPGAGIWAGLDRIWRDAFLRNVVLVCALANFLFQITILMLVIKAHSQGYSSTQIGLYMMTTGVSGLLGSLAGPRLVRRATRRGTPTAFVACCFALWVVLLWGVWAAGPAVLGLAAWGLCSFFGSLVNIVLAAYQAQVPAEILGKVTSTSKFITTGAVSLGALSSGYAVEAFGPDTTAFAVAVCITAVVAVSAWNSRAELRHALTALRRPVAKAEPVILLAAPVAEAPPMVDQGRPGPDPGEPEEAGRRPDAANAVSRR
ncbi:MFS transporter [Actinocorallia sp. API 0066]|uniref:MFS transporter n=1 Tax=Actinocorallia sp. API 0066 TaxID=2896846 RepID=UPI001E2F3196|nr:MFS transporter [Actinocorallia sp. API 0066]MCD0452390.1 MFS transporter [Actinocorallia sp. API 0066]